MRLNEAWQVSEEEGRELAKDPGSVGWLFGQGEQESDQPST